MYFKETYCEKAFKKAKKLEGWLELEESEEENEENNTLTRIDDKINSNLNNNTSRGMNIPSIENLSETDTRNHELEIKK